MTTLPRPSPSLRSRLGGLAANILLSLTVVVVLAGLLEGVGRLIEGEQPERPVAAYLWNWDNRWGGDFYTVGTDTTGWPPGREFNADGLRDRFRPEEKPERTWRIACLGDSVTMGAGIASRQAFPQVLERSLWLGGRRIEVMNVALWGWSTRQERIAYRRIARRYHPDQVILGVCLNDIAELQNNLTQPPALLAWLHERSALVRVMVGARRREIASVEELFRSPSPPKVDEGLQRFFSEIRALRDATLADGAQLDVLIFPFRFQVEPGAPAPSVQARITDFCRGEGIPVLDVLPRLAPLTTRAFVDYDHLSAEGAAAVAQAVATSGWLPEGYSDRHDLEAFFGRSLSPPPTAADLCRALEAPDAEVRQAACGMLLWSDDLSVNTALIADLGRMIVSDPSRGVRATASRALGAWAGRYPGVHDTLIRALRDESECVRAQAALAIADVPPRRQDVDELAGLLAHPDPYVASFAAWRLGQLGRDAAGAVPALTRALDRDDRTRLAVARALAQLGAVGREAVPALVGTLDSDDPKARLNAVRALGRVGPSAAEAVGPLTERLSDASGPVRAEAARALGRIGLAARPAAEKLIERLGNDEDPQVRAMAARALGWIVGARGAHEALEAATADRRRRVAHEARKALARLGSR